MAYFTEVALKNNRWKDIISYGFKNVEDRNPVKGAAYFWSQEKSLKY